jgi:hypothetical protein
MHKNKKAQVSAHLQHKIAASFYSWILLKRRQWLTFWMGQVVRFGKISGCLRVPKQHFPELYSFAKDSIHSSLPGRQQARPLCFICLFHQLHCSNWQHYPKTFLALMTLMNRISGHIFGGSPIYSSSKAYIHITGHRVVHAAFKWLWKSACQNKHRVFFWLLLKDMLSTRELLRRKNIFSLIIPVYAV